MTKPNDDELWSARLYDASEPDRLETIYGQLCRLSTHRAVFMSLHRMLTQSGIDPGMLFWNLLKDGYSCDQVLSLRRLIESNNTHGRPKGKDKQVNSLMGLAEYLNDCCVIQINQIALSINNAANKVFSHNDLNVADKKRPLEPPTYNDLGRHIEMLHEIAICLGKKIGVELPDNSLPINQFDWSESFSMAWRSSDFNDDDIWGR